MRRWRRVASLAVIAAGCGAGTPEPAPEILITNLKSNVLGSAQAVCGQGPGLSLTQFTFDFAVRGSLDVSSETTVVRVMPAGASPEAVILGPVTLCSTGPCTSPPRACVTAGRPTGSGTIEVAATEALQAQSSWTLELRQGGASGVRSNPLTVVVTYPQ